MHSLGELAHEQQDNETATSRSDNLENDNVSFSETREKLRWAEIGESTIQR